MNSNTTRIAWLAGASEYLIGIGATAIIVLVRFAYASYMGVDAPFILFQIAVLAAAWKGGLKPGLVTTALVVVVGYLSQSPDTPQDVMARRLGILFSMSLFVSLIAERLHQIGRRAEGQKERLRITLASIGDGVVTTDAAGAISHMNPAAVVLIGWTDAEAKGRPIGEVFRIVNETTRLPVDNPVTKALASNKVVGLANHTILISKNGSEWHIDDSAAPIHSRDGELLGCVLIFRDITERRQAELSLAEKNRLTTLRADASAALSGDKDMRTGLQTCAEAIVEQLEVAFARIWTLEEMGEILVLRASAGLYTHLNGPHGRVRVGEYKIGRIAKNRLPHLTNDVPHDENVSDQAWAEREGMVAFAGYPLMVDGRVVGVVAVFARRKLSEAILTDLSSLAGTVALYIERKNGEEKLLGLEARRRLALDSAELGSWHIEPATMTLTTDERFCTIFGVPARQRLDYEQAVALIHTDDRSRVRDAVAAATRPDDPAPYAVEYRVTHPDGSIRWVFAKGKANYEVQAGERKLKSFDGTVADITQRRNMENELRQLAADLSETDRRKNEFLATLAHELRNPLAPIRNALQLVRLAHPRWEIVNKARDIMERQLQQMVRLIDDLLEISRISQGKITLQKERLPLKTAIENAIESSRPLIEASGHELTVRPSPELIFVEADPTRLAQVFLNLLNNSAKYTDSGGRIWLTTDFADGEAVVTVKDTGVGIPADMLPKVFDLFTQVDRSLEKSQGGLGIGLSLVKRLVEMHDGTVEAKSEGPGKGCEFIVRLPATVEEREKAHGDEVKVQVIPQTSHSILIADDNTDSADSLGTLLELMGNEVRIVYDGQAAVETAEKFRPSVVLLDIGMPRLNGLEAAKRLRQREWGKGMVLIALTGWGQEDDVRRTSEAGFDHHMTKPVDPEKLMKLLVGLRIA